MNAKEKRPKHQRLRRFLSLEGVDTLDPPLYSTEKQQKT